MTETQVIWENAKFMATSSHQPDTNGFIIEQNQYWEYYGIFWEYSGNILNSSIYP